MRQSGRTTRMLERVFAHALKAERNNVAVLGWSTMICRQHLAPAALRLMGEAGMKFEFNPSGCEIRLRDTGSVISFVDVHDTQHLPYLRSHSKIFHDNSVGDNWRIMAEIAERDYEASK